MIESALFFIAYATLCNMDEKGIGDICIALIMLIIAIVLFVKAVV